MKIRDIMTEKVEWVAPETNIQVIAKLMADEDVGAIPVCQGDKILGVITDRDIIIRAVAKGLTPDNAKAKDIMSTSIVSVSSDTDVHEAADIMSDNQIRRLPVVDNGKLVGIVALGDLAIEKIHINEAGDALSDISQGIQH